MLQMLYLICAVFSTCILVFVLWTRHQARTKLDQHYSMHTLTPGRLPKDSPTRKRLEATSATFERGWQALATADPHTCLRFLALAVEMDEMACSWKHDYDLKMERIHFIGDFFASEDTKDVKDKYASMLAEAYLVVLLFQVLASYEKHGEDMAEDYKVVKSRMDMCVQLQKDNPMVYKLRADFLKRFGAMADQAAIARDLEKAIQLARADEDGRTLTCGGIDCKQQRLFVLAWCHHQRACMAMDAADQPRAREHFEAAIKCADPDFPGLAYCHFSLAVITLMSASKKVEPSERPAVMLEALTHFNNGIAAEKRALRALPFVKDVELPRSLAKALLTHFTKGG